MATLITSLLQIKKTRKLDGRVQDNVEYQGFPFMYLVFKLLLKKMEINFKLCLKT